VSVQFTLDSDEGLPIRGNLDVPDEARALVILIHGFKGFKDWGFFPWVAKTLVEERFAVCRFNMSRSGIGDSPEAFDRLDLFAGDTLSTQLADLRTVVAHAQHNLNVPVFLLGHSRGGGVAILGAARVPNLHGVIAWNPIGKGDHFDDATKKKWKQQGFFDFENSRTKQMMRLNATYLDDAAKHDIEGAAAALNVPLLAIAGGRDESVDNAASRALAARASDKALIVIGTAGHTFNAAHPMGDPPFQLDLATGISIRFVAAHAE
jgi:pimeloyl-ACP methyl ester carboxylesterase